MAFCSRELLLLVVLALMASLAPADGFSFDRVSAQPSGLNKRAGESSPPTSMSVGCSCDNAPAHACHCGVGIDTTINGSRIQLDPKVNVEFFPKNVSFVMTVTNQGKTLFTRVISGEKMIPPVCVAPLPQLPFVVLCVSLNNLSLDEENKSVSFCSVFEVNTAPVSLPMKPTVPVGCFKAGLKDGITYTAPGIKFPDEDVNNLISGLPQFPPPFGNWANSIQQAMSWPFGGFGESGGWPFGGWPFGRPAPQQGNKLEAELGGEMNIGADGANANAQISF